MTLPTPKLGDGEEVEQLVDHLGGGADLGAEVVDQQPPGDKTQQKQQQAGPHRVGHIDEGTSGSQNGLSFLAAGRSPEGEAGPHSRIMVRNIRQSRRVFTSVPWA